VIDYLQFVDKEEKHLTMADMAGWKSRYTPSDLVFSITTVDPIERALYCARFRRISRDGRRERITSFA
jgi:hypothetical protein